MTQRQVRRYTQSSPSNYNLVRNRCVVGNSAMYLVVVHQESSIVVIRKIILKSAFCLCYHLKSWYLCYLKGKFFHKYVYTTIMMLMIIIKYYLILVWWSNNCFLHYYGHTSWQKVLIINQVRLLMARKKNLCNLMKTYSYQIDSHVSQTFKFLSTAVCRVIKLPMSYLEKTHPLPFIHIWEIFLKLYVC